MLRKRHASWFTQYLIYSMGSKSVLFHQYLDPHPNYAYKQLSVDSTDLKLAV